MPCACIKFPPKSRKPDWKGLRVWGCWLRYEPEGYRFLGAALCLSLFICSDARIKKNDEDDDDDEDDD